MLNPCCCISPRIGVFVFAIVDLLLAAGYVWGVIRSIFDSGFRSEMIGELIIAVALLGLAILLLLGALKNSAEKIRLWLILWIVYLIICVVFQVFNIWSHQAVNLRTGSSLVSFLIFLYQIWVVYAYLTELRCGPAGLTYCPTQITV
ncbi:unnamed protein product [Orchesella dallaii]|uniref:Uncharacterized protein n=1 Tax=Orchesella dallaii TaxID=48710 RepID=A0ABP1R7Y3_9HEXA